MAQKEKGSFDLEGIVPITRNILQRKVEEKPAAAAPIPAPASGTAPVPVPPEKKEPKPVKEKTVKGLMVKTSYHLKKEQMDALKKIAFWTGKDYSEVLREIVDHGLERVEKKNPELLKEPVQKDLF